jgi:hypothetical protein
VTDPHACPCNRGKPFPFHRFEAHIGQHAVLLVWPGKGRGVRTTRDVETGQLLLVARPSAAATARPGMQPQPGDLHAALGAADPLHGPMQALRMLCDGSEESMQRVLKLSELASCRVADSNAAAAGGMPAGAGIDADSLARTIDLNAYGEPWGDGTSVCVPWLSWHAWLTRMMTHTEGQA